MVRERKLTYGIKNAENISSARSLPTVSPKSTVSPKHSNGTPKAYSLDKEFTEPDISKVNPVTSDPSIRGASALSSRHASPKRPTEQSRGASNISASGFKPKEREYELKDNIDRKIDEKIHRESRRIEGADLFLDVVVEKLCKVSISKFGGIKQMMKKFRKTPEEKLTKDEMNKQFQKFGLNEDFNQLEIDLLYERIEDMSHRASLSSLERRNPAPKQVATPTSNDGISVSKLIETVQLMDSLDDDSHRQQKTLANFLVNEVSKRRKDMVESEVDRDSQPKESSLTLKEIDDAVDAILETTSATSLDPEERERNKFARQIRLTHTKLDMIPFYHMRQKELSLLHQNEENLKALLTDPALFQRRQELIDKIHNHASNQATYYTSQKVKPVKPTVSEDKPENTREPISALPGPRNLSTTHGSSLLETTMSRDDYLPLVSKPYQSLKERVEYGSGILSTSVEGQAHVSSGRFTSRSTNQLVSSAERVGLSMGYDDPDHAVHRRQSSNAAFYSYTPEPASSAPSSEYTLSSNSIKLPRPQLYKYRYRHAINEEYNIDKAELDAINDRLKMLRKCRNTNHRMLQHKQDILLSDMHCYRQGPAALLSRKPNFAASDRMRGSEQIFPLVKEDRDFTTTSTAAYNR